VGRLALSTPATVALIAGVVLALAFVGGLIALALRRRGETGPDIPPGMRPGPADEVLERRQLEKVMGWGVVFVLFFALWLPFLWLREPAQNVDDEIDLIARSEERGSHWFQLSSEENPTGFGCARCHGEEAQGGSVPYTTSDGEFIPAYPVPALNTVCGGPFTGHPQIKSVDDIRNTIMMGREGTPMPSWSVRFAGPMNDQQIQDLITYLISIQKGVPEDQNVCTNPEAATAAATPQPGPTTSGASPAPEGSPTGESG
jgi:mono/diheme cytochrome c family protein